MDYGYQWEKLCSARRCLMLPHSKGIEQSIADCFHDCSLAFHRLDESGLDSNAKRYISVIKDLMDTTGLVDPSEKGLWFVKAHQFTTDQQLELSRNVDELAYWFGRSLRDD